MTTIRLFAPALLTALLPLAAHAQLPPVSAATGQKTEKPATPTASTDPIERIKDEGMNRSQVMPTLSYLTDVIGPRLTGSPALKRANEWTRDQMTKWGLQNAHLEVWGPFGRGWSLQDFSAEWNTASGGGRPLDAFPKAWSPNVDLTNAEVVFLDIKNVADLQKYKGLLKGKVVLNGATREIKPHFDGEATRVTDKELLEMADAPDPDDKPMAAPTGAPNPQQLGRMRAAKLRYATAGARNMFYVQEGVALVLDPSRAGDGGNIFVQQATAALPVDTTSMETMYNAGAHVWDVKQPTTLPQAVVSIEQYNRLARMLQQGEKVTVNVHLSGQYHEQDPMAYNTVAELPGTDKKDEVVMVGGHLDSWHGGTGATDNAAGVAVAMEAMRILKTLGLQPRRTIRMGLWTGEEQGIMGSEAYVKQHFGEAVKAEGKDKPAPGTPPRVATKPEWSKLAAYFNLDNGGGKIRGVYMQGNEAVRPIFRQWLAPFKDMGATTLTLENTGGTDHLSFDAVGLPGFQFIQDELEYNTRTHHSTQDVYDRVPAEDLKQAATIMAAFIYNAAMRDEPLPRKPVTVVKDAKKPKT